MRKFTEYSAVALAAVLAVGGGTALAEGEMDRQSDVKSDSELNRDIERQETGGYESGEVGGYQGAQPGKQSGMSRDFINNVAQKNMTEIELARLAQSKASHPQVKTFASSMVKDHEKLSSELKQISNQVGVQAQSYKASDVKGEIQDLQGLAGRDFDKQFLSKVVDTHQQVIDEFVKVAEDENADPKLRTWAIDNLPKLRHHILNAQDVQSQLSGTSKQRGSMDSGSPSGGMDKGKTGGGY